MKKLLLKKYILFLSILATYSVEAKKAIIWDLGFTLVKTNTMGVAGEIGWGTCISNFFNGTGSSNYLRNTMYAILLQGSGCQQHDTTQFVRDEHGAVLPLLMADHWLTNKLTTNEIIALTDQYIEDWDKQKKFNNRAEKKMLKGIMRTVFSPTIVAKHTSVVSNALKLVQKCALRNCRQYILSNWEQQSFETLYANKNNQKLFKYIKRPNITISGDCGMIKPHATIFTYFLEKYNLNPADCVLIDDQEENILQARACGIYAIHLKNGNYKAIEKELIKINAL